MTQPYWRPVEASSSDFRAARPFERTVGLWLPPHHVPNLDATDKLDYWVPGYYLEIKEKRQRLTARWHLLPGVAEVDLFVIDELSVRRAAASYPASYFLLRDLPGGDRLFLARTDEIWFSDKVRRNRAHKGKLILDLTSFRQLASGELLHQTIIADQASAAWERTECVSHTKEIAQV